MGSLNRLNSSRPLSGARVKLSDVNKRFGSRLVLSSINLELEPGSFHVLIGPSGCGKTTLLRILGGLESPSSGSVKISSVEVSSPNESSDNSSCAPVDFQGLGYGFQEPRLLPWLKVSANIALPLTLSGADPELIEARVAETLEQMRLSDAADLYPRQLSGGMKMRVAIGRALVSRPQVLLLDEPFGALDELTKSRLDDELYQLWRELKMTVVLVTHSLSEAVYLGEHIHVLKTLKASDARGEGDLDQQDIASLEGSMRVTLGARSPELRLTPEFTEALAETHALLRRAEGAAS